MIGVSAFISKVREIAARELTYRTGGVGRDGTCDCIGLIMGAMYEMGVKKYDMHSTNYFARYQTLELKEASAKELHIGQILYRARESTAQLNERYQPGGRYYTGDMLDYYHVGVVTRMNPLEITECTEYGDVSGIVISSQFKNWQYAGRLRGVLYDEYEEKEAKTAMYKARVVTKSGALNIREWPEKGPIMGKAPKGVVVDVLHDTGDGWPEIQYGGVTGYASDMYLAEVEIDDPQESAGAETTGGKTWIGVEAFTVLKPVGGGEGIVLGGEWEVDRVVPAGGSID